MERKTFSQVQIGVREAYNRAAKFASSGNYSEAVRILVPVIKENPSVAILFEKLREYEIAKSRTTNPLIKLGWNLISPVLFIVIKIVGLIDSQLAMRMCEGPLASCVDQPLILTAMADVSEASAAPWGAATALNVIRVFHPNNEANLRRLAVALQNNNQAVEGLKIFRILAKKHPTNLAMQNELRAAMALSSIEAGKWEDKGSTQDKTDLKDALINQLLQGTIHDAEQAQILIDKFEEDLATNDSVDIRRKLADAYMVKEDFEAAYAQYSAVAEKLGVSDPVLDKQIERAKLAQFDKEFNIKAQEGASEEELEALRKAREDYHESRVISRAKSFPNDIQLQFDLAELRFEQGSFAEAKEIFESVCENPQKRRASLVYLGRCALLMNNPAEAEPLLAEAVKDMYRMDKYRREALYYLAIAYEGNGKPTEAMDCYKTIRANMENYRDIKERMAALDNASGVEQE